MPGKRDRARRCRICPTPLYEDEPGRVCPDCRAILDRLHGLHLAVPVRSMAPEAQAERDRRIAAHAARVAGELRRINAGRVS